MLLSITTIMYYHVLLLSIIHYLIRIIEGGLALVDLNVALRQRHLDAGRGAEHCTG